MSDESSTRSPSGAAAPSSSVVLLFKGKASPDAELALSLGSELRKRGHQVSMDQKSAVGLAWARELEQHLLQADLVVILVSAASAQSELLAYELEVAAQVAEKRGGLPGLLPIRVYYRGPLSEALSVVLQPIEFEWSPDEERYVSRMVFWRSPADDRAMADRIEARLAVLAAERAAAGGGAVRSAVPRLLALESVGGAVPLDSRFYVERTTDAEFRAAVARRDSLVMVKGARQMGKTSLLARGLQQAREAGSRVVMTDFQKLQAGHFASLEDFYMAMAELVADQLDLELPEVERFQRNPNAAFERFWAKGLETLQRPVLWAMDEFDRLFTTSIGGEVCGLLRSWHNARALDPELPWRHLTIAIAYATEAHLFINDLNQSPFNVGTRLALEDFTGAEVEELNERYGGPLAGGADVAELLRLLGGQPYLVRCAFNEMSNQGRGIGLIAELAEQEESVFGEHLRRLLYSVGRDAAVTAAIVGLLKGQAPSADVFYRLRSAGVVVGVNPAEARIRCALYERFLQRHLAPQE